MEFLQLSMLFIYHVTFVYIWFWPSQIIVSISKFSSILCHSLLLCLCVWVVLFQKVCAFSFVLHLSILLYLWHVQQQVLNARDSSRSTRVRQPKNDWLNLVSVFIHRLYGWFVKKKTFVMKRRVSKLNRDKWISIWVCWTLYTNRARNQTLFTNTLRFESVCLGNCLWFAFCHSTFARVYKHTHTHTALRSIITPPSTATK